MAKKKTSKKKPASRKKTPARKPAALSKKKTTKKPTTKKSTKKPASKRAPAKKPTAKKTTPKKAPAKKPVSKKAPAKAEPKKAKPEPAAKADEKKSGRKGITIVDNKQKRRSSPPRAPKITAPPPGTGLLSKRRKPLISSGPKAPASPYSTFGESEEATASKKKLKSPFNKRELNKFREILVAKRAELVGDVATMEQGVLSLGDKGGDPATDVAEQGSDAYDQSLSIGLAEVDRKLIREVDDAIERIDSGIYGLCEVTHQPISRERLQELPWTRLSIEAAREVERGGVRR